MRDERETTEANRDRVMKQFRTITICGGLAAAILAAGCSSSTNGGSGGGHGSTTGTDMDGGGDPGAGSTSGGDGGGTSLGFGGDKGQGGATGSASAPGSGSAGSVGGAGSTSSHGGAASVGGATSGGGPITSVTPVGSAKVCSAQSAAATAGILDVFVMLDRSLSMNDDAAGGTKWDVITQSLDNFLQAPESASISAGIGFFGISSGTSDRGASNSSCTAADYAKPVVPIAVLGGTSGNASKIAAAIESTKPATNTPTEPALQGAIDYASSWAKAHATHKVIVVFATDGLPNGCTSTIEGASKIAAAGVAASPSIKTYVIGVFGDKDCPGGVTQGQSCAVVSNTNAIAKGGGTGSAFIVNASASTGEQFLGALNAIRAANQVGCTFKVTPPAAGTSIDFTRASVVYTSGTGPAQPVTWRTSAAQCGSAGGWYYNSNTAPNQLSLCDATCKVVSADVAAKLDVALACEPPGTTTGGGGASNGGGAPGTGTAGASSGSGGTGSGAGGAGSGAGGASGSGGDTSCLLSGQSCQTSAECCGGLCAAGVCTSIIR